SNVETRTCTTSDGKTIAVSHGTYSGTALGDADLAGAITLGVHSVINTTDNVGIVEGRLKIDVASGDETHGHSAAGAATGTPARPRRRAPALRRALPQRQPRRPRERPRPRAGRRSRREHLGGLQHGRRLHRRED